MGRLGHSVGNGLGVNNTALMREKRLLCGAGSGYWDLGRLSTGRGGVVVSPNAEDGRSGIEGPSSDGYNSVRMINNSTMRTLEQQSPGFLSL